MDLQTLRLAIAALGKAHVSACAGSGWVKRVKRTSLRKGLSWQAGREGEKSRGVRAGELGKGRVGDLECAARMFEI